MATELTPKEREKIKKIKIRTIADYQHQLDVYREKIRQWDVDVATKKSEMSNKFWEQGKNEMVGYEKAVQAEIHRLIGVPEEAWESNHDKFKTLIAEFGNVYMQVLSKIRYDNPGDHVLDRAFKHHVT
jgi:predicted ATP-binding protein involved in virulence